MGILAWLAVGLISGLIAEVTFSRASVMLRFSNRLTDAYAEPGVAAQISISRGARMSACP